MADDTAHYNPLARAFHWGIALFILVLLVVGFMMGGLEYGPFKIQVYSMHKAIGFIVLWLVAFRIIWRFVSTYPKSLSAHKNWEKALSKTIHVVLYFAMIAMPLSGWVMTSAGDFPASFFGLFELPKIVAKNEQIFETSREIHEIIAFIIIGCVGLHIIGALKHHVIDRDATLTRMGGRLIFTVFGLLLLAVASYFPAVELLKGDVQDHDHQHGHEHAVVSDHNDAVHDVSIQSDVRQDLLWSVNSDSSHIEFTYQQYGSAVQGAFNGFDSVIAFDLKDMTHNYAKIVIDASSIETGSQDRDEQARSALWFAVSEFPEIVFETNRFEVAPDGPEEDMGEDRFRYMAHGELMIRGTRVPISFPFTLHLTEDGSDEQGQHVVMDAQISLNRLDFGVGQGVWESTDAVADLVSVDVHVEASRP